MQIRPPAVITLVLVLLSWSIALRERASGESNQQQKLIQLEQHWLEVEDNPDALESILADDFIHVLPAGFVTKAQQLKYMRAHPATERTKRHFDDLRVRVYGTVGVANGIVVATDNSGKLQRTIFTDVFAYRNSKWQAVNAQELPLNESAHP